MRPIDADALKENTLAHGEKIAYVASFLWDIDDSPTIAAIPVEWLKAQIRSYTGDVSDIGKSARNGTIKDLIRKWQKEQEAR